jgi:hypothetical protein
MSNSMIALSTPISPPSEPAGGRKLAGSVVPRASLSAAERAEMYRLFETYFAGTSREQFEADLAEKETVVLLRTAESETIQGFSTLMRIEALVDERNIVAFFSGDTIVAREYWGEPELSKLWSGTVFAEADRIRAKNPETRVYWFLICSGYKTWRFLPVFFREFYPHPEAATPAKIQKILDALGERKFGAEYCKETGVVRLRSATPLREGVADVTEPRLRDPRVAFFVRMNPGYLQGDELACLAELCRANLTRAGERMLGTRENQRR